jgi:hypothetical protein
MKEIVSYVFQVAVVAVFFTAVCWGLLRLVRKFFDKSAVDSYSRETARANKAVDLELLKHKLESQKQTPRDGEQK